MAGRTRRWMFYLFVVLVPASTGILVGSAVRNQEPGQPPDSEDSTIRFFAMGDTGTGLPEQHKVARAVFDQCKNTGCDFGILLGDNIYPSGVTSATDPQWESKFERPYANLLSADMPFYAVLGNHDYDDGRDFTRGAHQVAYGQLNPRWKMPAEYYTFEAGKATFLALNTEWIASNHQDAAAVQGKLVRHTIATSTKHWKIALGHHPYRSNGTNGNAGAPLSRFFEDHVCGAVDLYLAGHDHNLQIVRPPESCQMLQVVSGGGGYATYPLVQRNPSHFQAQSLGFAYVTVSARRLTIQIVNDERKILFTHEVSKDRLEEARDRLEDQPDRAEDPARPARRSKGSPIPR